MRMNLPERLSELVSAELYDLNGVLSCLRLNIIWLETGKSEYDEELFDKQQAYMDKFDQTHSDYIMALGEVNNNILKSALSMECPAKQDEFPEYAEVFRLLEELRKISGTISELNSHAIEITTQLMHECRENIKAVKNKKALLSGYDTDSNPRVGSILNYDEGR